MYTGNKRYSKTTSIPAPVGGWNARDPEADMDPRDALDLINIFPGTGDVKLRKGYTEHVTGIVDEVETLMPYNAPDGTQDLYAAAGTSFYDVTSAGAVGAAVQTGLTNARWRYVNFTNTDPTSYLCCFNGVDSPRYWNGSNWITITGASSPAITGVTTSSLDSPWVHKRRMWLVEKGTLSLWYLPADSVGGAATEFPLYGLFKRGGYIVAGGTWTVDGGDGVDDLFVVVTSEGEIAVYQGTDPSAANTWALVGVYRTGEPIGKNCLLKYTGDMLVLTKNGILPLSRALQSAQIDPSIAITDKISGAIADSVRSYSSTYGWQMEFYPAGNMLILNVPVTDGQEQYVMNSLTGAWARFRGIEANCWAILNGEPHFGAGGFVGRFWNTNADNDTNITGDIQQAYSYFRNRGSQKIWTMLRPIFRASGAPSVLASLNPDFERGDPSAALSFTPITGALWDTAIWDTDLWVSSNGVVLKDWQGAGVIGNCAGLRLTITAKGLDVSFQATDYVYQEGGVI